MIEKALKYVVGMSAPNINKVNNEWYSDKQLYRVKQNPKAEGIQLTTLNSLILYLKSGYDNHGNVFLHIESPTCVRMISSLDEDRKREFAVVAKANVPSFNFGSYISHEDFCIALQSKFVNALDRALLLKFAGTVENGSVQEYGDDGVTQKATVKTGIASKSDAIVPNPVRLKAYRTFIEVDQPETQYVFRMKSERNPNTFCAVNEVKCALFEADGGLWKMDAMKSIYEYLHEETKDMDNVTVIY